MQPNMKVRCKQDRHISWTIGRKWKLMTAPVRIFLERFKSWNYTFMVILIQILIFRIGNIIAEQFYGSFEHPIYFKLSSFFFLLFEWQRQIVTFHFYFGEIDKILPYLLKTRNQPKLCLQVKSLSGSLLAYSKIF
jgi:hypothetical protein